MSTIKAKDGTLLDAGTVLLAKAIRQVESQTTFDAKGSSGESGAYQYMPQTWASWAKTYLGDANAEMTPENQDKVAYQRIASLKEKGYSPSEVASIWNSGSPVWEGKTGVNKYGVRYDVPAYVNKVINEYKNQQSSFISLQETQKEDMLSLIPKKKIFQYDKENNWFQSLVVSAASLPVNSYRIFKAGLLTLFNAKGKDEALLNLDQPVNLPFDLGTVDPIKNNWEGVKQILGQTLQAEAWVLPSPVKGASIEAKTLSWFGRGFAFGAGDSLEKGDSVEKAIVKGSSSGLVTAGLGRTLTSISDSFAKSLEKNGTFQKMRVKFVSNLLKGKTEEEMLREMRIANQSTLFESAKTSITNVIKEESKGILSPKILVGITTGSFFYPAALTPVLAGLAGTATWTFVNTLSGRLLLTNVVKVGVETLSKVDAPLRNEIAVPFFTELINQMTNQIYNSFKDSGLDERELKLK